jgi:hypothetical protein
MIDFLEFFTPQTVFIGKWGTKFNFFLDFFPNFLTSNGQKNNQICIKMTKFIFKRSNLNSNRSIRS